MKKLVALILICCMLFGYAAAAEETLMESAFLNGAETLLKSIDLARDMLTLNVNVAGNSMFDAKLKQQENMVDLSVSAADATVQTQISDTDISVSANGMAFNLQYADVQALVSSLTANAPQMEIYQEIVMLLFEKVVMPDVTMDSTDGLHITYAADEKQLLTHLDEFIDGMLADARYSAAAEQALHIITQAAGGEMMTLAQFKEEIQRELEMLDTRETDFAIAFELKADKAFTQVDVTGEIGDSRDKYAMTWTYRKEADSYQLDGLLWETRVIGEKERKYQITVNADFAGDTEQNLWSLTIDHPSVGFNLEASGNQQGKMGSFCFYFNNLYRLGDGFLVQLDYAVEDDGLIATALVTPGRLGNYVATLVLGEQQLNLTVKNTAGRKLFWLNLRADEDRQLKYGYMEYQPNPMANPFNTRPNAAQSKITAEYDGEKLVINQNGVTITCTGAFESDHAYVITLHAEGETVRPEENEAYIRCEYEGEEGNFAFSGRVIDPTGQDALVLRFACAPTEGMNELLREKDGVIRLTPETLQMLLQQ